MLLIQIITINIMRF